MSATQLRHKNYSIVTLGYDTKDGVWDSRSRKGDPEIARPNPLNARSLTL
jgi:hypothetical protein